MYTAPFVVRSYFHSQDEAAKAHEQLEMMGVFGDMVPATGSSEPYKWKVVFMDKNMMTIKVALKRLTTKPALSEIFDVTNGWEGGFKTLPPYTAN